MAGGLRVSELTHLQWKNLCPKARVLRVPVSKTAAGHRGIALEPELAQLLHEHKVAAKWSQPDDFIFPGRSRKKARDRNSVRTKILYPAIERANEQLATEDRPPFPAKVAFHSLRRTYAAIRAELGEHPAVTAAQMGHRDPRMTLRVYTDVTGVKPRTRMGGLLGDDEWAPSGHQEDGTEASGTRQPPGTSRKVAQMQARREAGATGLEPATSGVTGEVRRTTRRARSGYLMRNDRGQVKTASTMKWSPIWGLIALFGHWCSNRGVSRILLAWGRLNARRITAKLRQTERRDAVRAHFAAAAREERRQSDV